MFVNAVKSSCWSAKTNGAQPCGQFVWIKSARKITKKNANSKAISVFYLFFSETNSYLLMISGAMRST